MSDTTTEGSTATGTDAPPSTESKPPAGSTSTPPPSTTDTAQTFDATYVAGLRTEAAGYRTKANAATTERDALQVERDALSGRLPELETRATKAERSLLQFQVAAEVGIPASFAARLQGSTREEILADANSVKGDLAAPDLGQGSRTPAGSGDAPGVNDALRALMPRSVSL